MFNQNTINPFIDQIVYTIDNMFEKKDIPQEIINYLYLVSAGMILNYGLDYTKYIYKAIGDTKYIYGMEDINNKLSKEEYERLNFDIKQNAYAISKVESCSQDGDITKILGISYTLLIANTNANKHELLEFIVHELNHILSSLNNTFIYKDNDLYFRYGLFRTRINNSKDKLETGRILNEVINTLQTEDIIKNIIKLKDFKIFNVKFNRALRVIKDLEVDEYRASGYEPFVNLFRPLYEKDNYRGLINNSTLEGKIDDIQEVIDHKLGMYSFDNMIDNLESLYKSYEFTKSIDLGTAYETSSQYLDYKNKYIYGLIDYKPEFLVS